MYKQTQTYLQRLQRLGMLLYTHTYIYIYTHIHSHIYTHTYTLTYTHTLTHTPAAAVTPLQVRVCV